MNANTHTQIIMKVCKKGEKHWSAHSRTFVCADTYNCVCFPEFQNAWESYLFMIQLHCSTWYGNLEIWKIHLYLSPRTENSVHLHLHPLLQPYSVFWSKFRYHVTHLEIFRCVSLRVYTTIVSHSKHLFLYYIPTSMAVEDRPVLVKMPRNVSIPAACGGWSDAAALGSSSSRG